MMDKEAMQTLINAIRSVQPIMAQDGNESTPTHGFVALPEGYTLRDVKDFLPAPGWINQEVILTHPESFCDYVKRYQDTEKTVVFADESAGQFVAVLDYHDGEVGDRGQCEHVANYKCPLTENWIAWKGSDGKTFNQVALGRFLEKNLSDITTPRGADMLQLALNLEVHKSAVFESGIRLDNGQRQFRYTEEVRGTNKAGEILIPDVFILKLPIFLDGPLHEILARFRYELKDGVLVLAYELVNPQEALRQAAKQVTAIIKEGLPGIPLWLGTVVLND